MLQLADLPLAEAATFQTQHTFLDATRCEHLAG